VRLSLSRTHAAQRLTLQNELRGTLGNARPSRLLDLPSFRRSLTDTNLPGLHGLQLAAQLSEGRRSSCSTQGASCHTGVMRSVASSRAQQHMGRAEPGELKLKARAPLALLPGKQVVGQPPTPGEPKLRQRPALLTKSGSPLAAAAAAVAADPGVQRFLAAANGAAVHHHKGPVGVHDSGAQGGSSSSFKQGSRRTPCSDDGTVPRRRASETQGRIEHSRGVPLYSCPFPRAPRSQGDGTPRSNNACGAGI
jgi:hypothetical protein